MSRNSRRSVAIAVAGAFAVAPMVTACAAGRTPQTTLPTQLAEGVNASAHLVDIRNVFLLGPAPGQRLPAGGNAPLYAWFVNRAATADKLVAVEAQGVAKTADVTGGGVALPPGKLITTVQRAGAKPPAPTASATPLPSRTPASRRPSAPGKTVPGKTPSATPVPSAPAPAPAPAAPSSEIVLTGLAKEFSGGETVRLTFHFQQAGVISLNVPVVPRAGSYATFAPAAVPVSNPPVAQPPAVQPPPAKPQAKPSTAAKAKKKPKTTA